MHQIARHSETYGLRSRNIAALKSSSNHNDYPAIRGIAIRAGVRFFCSGENSDGRATENVGTALSTVPAFIHWCSVAGKVVLLRAITKMIVEVNIAIIKYMNEASRRGGPSPRYAKSGTPQKWTPGRALHLENPCS
jgi:hypothetical protein